MPRPIRNLAAAGLVGALLAGAAVVPATAASTTIGGGIATVTHRTTPLERLRVDRVPTPKLDWYECYDYAECATVDLPLDYDQPKGATTEIAVLRVKARDQKRKIGSLFVNPGGPGGSGTDFALTAPYYLGDEVLDRFDIVGIDPRGVNTSEQVRCFKSVEEQTRASEGLFVSFPYTKAEEKAYVASSIAVGKACSTTGKPLSGAMSTAQVARDMDVLRRAVGDKKLSYLGLSYGSVLGQYYANMFPDRVRAVAIDGVLDATAWFGSGASGNLGQEERMRSAQGAYKALREIFKRCRTAGVDACPLASGDPAAQFELVAQRLKAKPVVIEDPEFGDFTITYADFVGWTLSNMYGPDGYLYIVGDILWLLTLTDPSATDATRAQARASVLQRAAQVRQQARADDPAYINIRESSFGVICTDANHPTDAASWAARAARADQRDPYFGRSWTWFTAPCARDTWTVRDEDRYTGPFDRRTVNPILVVGNYWDPSTNYNGAVATAKLLPNSRLLSSDNWGHTAYGTSACATDAIDAYLLRQAMPKKGSVCHGDIQPFEELPESAAAVRVDTSKVDLAARGAPRRGEPKQLPPVVAPMPAVGSLTVR
ncbi:alpha/beta hydrolase [Micromonospora craniellae]|uniref:Alpha/beta hydrolase n=1 Tax=Micromonospora craniellae TaxID=2294034 RepID=A0A372G205_9ACTN|nr:alpha/beta hydrolase [Micromonospora craniellae]QOC89943.1 alpha/beta fold hydrolase [Micromonospora craniellae]RFS47087.1 alpha/beta hydrolase [Micromonospora craniellae]